MIAKTHGTINAFGEDVSLVDPDTGEVFTARRMIYDSVDKNFTKIWLGHMLDALESLGNKKIQLVCYLLDNRGKNNIIFASVSDLQKRTKLSNKTIIATLKALEQSGVIKRRAGVIIFNPDVIFKGSHDKRMDILYTYKLADDADKLNKGDDNG